MLLSISVSDPLWGSGVCDEILFCCLGEADFLITP